MALETGKTTSEKIVTGATKIALGILALSVGVALLPNVVLHTRAAASAALPEGILNPVAVA